MHHTFIFDTCITTLWILQLILLKTRVKPGYSVRSRNLFPRKADTPGGLLSGKLLMKLDSGLGFFFFFFFNGGGIPPIVFHRGSWLSLLFHQLSGWEGVTRRWVCSFVRPFLPLTIAELSGDSSSELLALSDNVTYQARHSFSKVLLFADPPTVFWLLYIC